MGTNTTPQQHAETLRTLWEQASYCIGERMSVVITPVVIDALAKGAEALTRSCEKCEAYRVVMADSQWPRGFCDDLSLVTPPQPFSCSRFTAKE